MRIHDYRISSKIRSTVVFRIHEQPPKTTNPQPAATSARAARRRRQPPTLHGGIRAAPTAA